jgi:hypothetical protein
MASPAIAGEDDTAPPVSTLQFSAPVAASRA